MHVMEKKKTYWEAMDIGFSLQNLWIIFNFAFNFVFPILGFPLIRIVRHFKKCIIIIEFGRHPTNEKIKQNKCKRCQTVFWKMYNKGNQRISRWQRMVLRKQQWGWSLISENDPHV
jgi:hypothetical protein